MYNRNAPETNTFQATNCKFLHRCIFRGVLNIPFSCRILFLLTLKLKQTAETATEHNAKSYDMEQNSIQKIMQRTIQYEN